METVKTKNIDPKKVNVKSLEDSIKQKSSDKPVKK